MARLDKKIALITGGTTGMGAASALRFKEEGATVIVTGSNPTTLEAARREMTGIEVIASDAGDPKAAKALVDEVKNRHGRIDVLFVNAGIAKFAPLEAVDEAFFDNQFNINVRGAYFLIKYAAPVMSDGGSIILTSSIAHRQGMAGASVYSASKAALRSFGRSLAVEFAPRKIRVNTISPGPIETPIFGKIGLTPEQMEGFSASMMAQMPLKRLGRSDEIAATALFLASDESSFTTAADIYVDGGLLEV